METATGAALLLSDLPKGALGGIDLLSFTTSPRFQGIKNIPAGIHFCFAGATSELSLRHGIWFEVPAHDDINHVPAVLIKQWDPKTESLTIVSDATEILRQRANLGSIWREYLTPYRQSVPSNTKADKANEGKESQAWTQLSRHITTETLKRVLGDTPNHWSLTSSSSTVLDQDDIAHLTLRPGFSEPDLNLLQIDLRKTWPQGATGRERTVAAQDRSWYITHASPNLAEVLAELQFTFLMVLTLNNYSCLAQWRRLLSLLLTCQSLVEKEAAFFVNALEVLRLQLAYIADDVQSGATGGLFELDEQGGKPWLMGLIRGFRAGIEQLTRIACQDVLDELDELEQYLADTFNWQFGANEESVRHGMLELEDGEQVEMDVSNSADYDREHEEGEYAPVVVDLG